MVERTGVSPGTRQIGKIVLVGFFFLVTVIVANSSPLPNVDHVMCLTRGEGEGGVVTALPTDFLSESCAWVDVTHRNVLVHAFCCRTERSYMSVKRSD